MYTNQEYAEMAIEANNNNKLLVINDNNELKLIDMVRDQADIISENEIKKSILMSEALNQLSLLQDAIELGIQQEGDEPRLKAWKTYRIQLSRVDTTIENIAFPPQPTN